jgi:hypothetical protein
VPRVVRLIWPSVTLGSDLVGVTVDTPLQQRLGNAIAIQNTGQINAQTARLVAKTVEDGFKSTIVNTGQIRASQINSGPGGTIELISDRGQVTNYGTLDASGDNSRGGRVRLEGPTSNQYGTVLARGYNGNGGRIELLGNNVNVGNNSFTSASGYNTGNGGQIFVGGGQSGQDPTLRNATNTYVGQGAGLYANAANRGNGGKIIVWSQANTQYYGNVEARGGNMSGNGGFVQISGRGSRYINGYGDVSAPRGMAGTIRLTP